MCACMRLIDSEEKVGSGQLTARCNHQADEKASSRTVGPCPYLSWRGTTHLHLPRHRKKTFCSVHVKTGITCEYRQILGGGGGSIREPRG